ncbi:response regulator receiver domain protein [Synechococcus sp. PCC 7335]|uniref:ATP-binding response regulator n=1 Tax=Synechococcus sp. (strain ATCC 29403 / PCC 7335) TaxID=91464 RepID=UPI00017EBC1E|nr:response regulator [Synechococcus sp. PCC 7335]EDX84792.1 response regulator receiver domain protein [Synechococcus sp. PCC 7335]
MNRVSNDSNQLRCLLLEDSTTDAELIVAILTNAQVSCDFTRVETESEFRSIIGSERIDLILADYSLPTFDGLSAIRIIQDICPDVPCILVSGILGEERAVEALKAGATDYIVKQRLELLAPAVERAIREKQEKQALRLATLEREESEKSFYTLTETMTDPLAVVVAQRDEGVVKDFVIRYLNKAACSYLSLHVEEAISKSIYAAVPAFKRAGVGDSGNSLFSKLFGVLVSGRPLAQEIVLQGHESITQQVVIDLRAAKLKDSLVLTWRDMTERYQLDEQRQQLLADADAARNEAEQANRFKDDFLATVSHELRSPLSVIRGWVALVESQPEEMGIVQSAFKVIEKNTVVLENLIEDLLDVSRIMEGKLSFTPELLSYDQLEQIVAQAVDAINIVASSKQLHISFQAQPLPTQAVGSILSEEKSIESNTDKLPPQVYALSTHIMADVVRLQQVIRNLLSNAVKFTPANGQVEVCLKVEESAISISIKDTGRGLKETEIPHLFKRFWQVPDTSAENKYRREKGLGIGLSISHYIMELHQGSIQVASGGSGKGSTFTIQLPTLSCELVPVLASKDAVGSQIDSRNIGSRRASGEIEDSLLRGIKVLVIEDYPDALEMYKLMLEAYGAEVRGVASAERGLATFETFKPDILVVDIILPDSDGYALIRNIRARRAHQGSDVPAIALTALAEHQYRTKALLAGFQVHVPKPIGLQEIVDVVAQLTKRR